FQPDQRHMMRERFAAGSWITGAEMFPSSDGKLRYDQSLREEMFSHVIGEFKKRSPKWNIFLCMETPDTWLASVGELPKRVEGLGELFDASPVVKARRLQSEML